MVQVTDPIEVVVVAQVVLMALVAVAVVTEMARMTLLVGLLLQYTVVVLVAQLGHVL
jgi:hypothetical protein